MVHLSTAVLSILAGSLIPLITTAITRPHVPLWMQGAITAILSGASGFITTATLNGGNLAWEALVGTSAITAVTAGLTHFLPQWKQSIEKKTAGFGVA